MDGGDFNYLFNSKKKKGAKVVLDRFHGDKQKTEFNSKKEDALLMIQKFCRSFLSNKHIWESI